MVNPLAQKFPIVVVNPLENDYQRVKGGGGESRVTDEQIESTRSRLLKECEAIRARLSSSQQGTQGFGVARLKLKQDSLAKTKRPRKAFNAETCPVIGDLDETGELLILVSPSGLDSLQKKIVTLRGHDAATLVSIESFSDLGLEHRFTSQSQQTITQHLLVNGQARIKIRMLRQELFANDFREELEQTLLDLTGIRHSPYWNQGNFALYGLSISSFEEAMSIARLWFIFSLELMPIYDVSGEYNFDVASIQVASNAETNSLPIVAIFDSGIDPNSPLESLVYKHEKLIPDSEYEPSHGTSVAALAATQDGIIRDVIVPRCRLLDVRAMPGSKSGSAVTEEILVDRLESAVMKYGSEVKIWNLSLAQRPGPQRKRFSDLGMILDNLRRRYGVLFFTAAGNCLKYRKWPPESTTSQDFISAPGDSLTSVTVGSIAQSDSPSDALAPGGAPSPFSPRGPVAYHLMKPDIVAPGGNIANDGATPIGVPTLYPNGEAGNQIGTSFSTPLVSGASAELYQYLAASNLSGLDTTLLVKAVLLHRAYMPNSSALVGNARLPDYLGFGQLATLDEMMQDPFWQSTSLIAGRLYPGQELVIDDFPYPDDLRKGKLYWGHVEITVVSEPLLDPSFTLEYARSNVTAHFGVVNVGKQGERDFTSQLQTPYTRPMYEKTLIREEHKWSPLKKYKSDQQLKCQGDYWRFKLELLLRDKESDALANDPGLISRYGVDIVALVTINDPAHTAQVNNQVFSKWRARGSVTTPIQVAPRIRQQV